MNVGGSDYGSQGGFNEPSFGQEMTPMDDGDIPFLIYLIF